MNSYEIRIVRREDNSQIVVTANLLGDHAAVRRARMLAAADDLVEVWRGMACVYSTLPNAACAYYGTPQPETAGGWRDACHQNSPNSF